MKGITAFVAQLGERKTEDLKVRGSIPRGGIFFYISLLSNIQTDHVESSF